MTDTAAPGDIPQDTKPKRPKRPLLIGFLLALVLGGAGFFATFTGLIRPPGAGDPTSAPERLPDIAFVPIEPLIVSLAPGAASRHLRFAAEIEVARAHQSEIVLLMPRVLDVLNGYLRAVSPSDIEDPAALVRLRAQMLRRVQMVTGEGRVRDLLVTEFVLN